MPEPMSGTNIHTIWTKVLTDKDLSYSQIKDKLLKFFPDIPPNSFHVHINALIKKGLARKNTMADGVTGFRRYKVPTQTDLLPEEPQPSKKKPRSGPINHLTLKYLKKHIGKTFTAGGLKAKLNLKGSGIWDVLKAFAQHGILEEQSNGRHLSYLVLPAIKDCSKPPSSYDKNKKRKPAKPKPEPEHEIIHAPIVHTMVHNPINEAHDITKLSYGELLSMVVAYREELMKLKMGIATITQGLLQTGEVEE